MNVFQKMFGTHSEREVKRIMPLVEKTQEEATAESEEVSKETEEK